MSGHALARRAAFPRDGERIDDLRLSFELARVVERGVGLDAYDLSYPRSSQHTFLPSVPVFAKQEGTEGVSATAFEKVAVAL